MGIGIKEKLSRFALPFCLCTCLCCFSKLLSGQSLDAPRFFTFNFQSLSGNPSPIAPQQSAFTPNDLEPNFLYEFSLRFPFKLKGKTKLLGEIGHQNEYSFGMYSFDDGDFSDVEPLELFQTSGSLILSHTWNERWKFLNVLNVRTNSNRHFNFDRRAMRYSNLSMVEHKGKKGDFGFGAAVSVNQGVTILPVIKYEGQLNDKWGLDIFVPSRALVTRRLSESSKLFMGARADAANYLLANDDDVQDQFIGADYRRISVNAVTGFEKQITKWVGFTAELGASIPLRAGIYDAQQPRLDLHNFRNRISPHVNVGFFLSLPR